MSYLKFILIIFSFIFFSSCGSVEKAFNNQKKDSSDEFLVEKKSALIMPPDYMNYLFRAKVEKRLEMKMRKLKV